MGEFDGYTLVPTSNLRRIADELGMEGGIYAPKLRREVLAYIEVSPSLFAEAQPPAAGVDAPSLEAAYAMGAKGAPANDAERLAFEAWMRGHCWALCATWNGTGYVSDAEQGGGFCGQASNTRRLWAAWRDRAALTAAPSLSGGQA